MNLADKVVLLTGGTGSFGRAFTRLVLRENPPRKLIIFSRDEVKQQEMREALPAADQPRLRFFLGDVRDLQRLRRAFHGVNVVVHTAALKQVPAAEYNPFEAIKTNVLGAANIIDAAIDQRVDKVIALSTDKAANPVNLYGATKLCADKLFIDSNSYSGDVDTVFSSVRYGNVMGSRGSVIPFFLKQRATGVLPVTDARMTRFWITLEQGVRFVLDCLDRMQGGEIFVPKIPSMKITDLAEAIAPGCRHEFVGIRPGEKLHETLISPDDARHTCEFEDFYVVRPEFVHWQRKIKEDAYRQAKPMPDGFSYTSDRNERWLTREDLSEIIPGIERKLAGAEEAV